jgi:uncharacterized membrane protein
MNTSRFGALQVGAFALVALALLQILWHAFILPPTHARFGSTLALSIVPLLPSLWICLRNLRRGVLIGGIVCLFYFCHGVSTAYGDSPALLLALAEIALTLIVIGALGWDARRKNDVGKPSLSPPMASKILPTIVAVACVPAGFAIPLVIGLQGLAVWPVAVCIWSVGVAICISDLPKIGHLRSWRSFALWTNAALAILFLIGYFLVGGITLH